MDNKRKVLLNQTQSPAAQSADANMRIHSFVLTSILILATAARFYGIDQSGLWGAELNMAWRISLLDWWPMLVEVVYSHFEPPGYATLLFLYGQFFGHSEFALRLPSVIAGIVTVLLLVQLGRQFNRPQAGLLAALLFALAPQSLLYSQQVQPYALLACVLLVQVSVFLELMNVFQKKNRTAKSVDAGLSAHPGVCRIVWAPVSGISGYTICLFWLFSFMLLFTSYAALPVLCVQAGLFYRYVREVRAHGVSAAGDSGMAVWRAVFMPLLVTALLLTPMLMIHLLKWISLLQWQGVFPDAWKGLLSAWFGGLYAVNIPFAVLTVVAIVLLVFQPGFLKMDAPSRSAYRLLLWVLLGLVMPVLLLSCVSDVVNVSGILHAALPFLLFFIASLMVSFFHRFAYGRIDGKFLLPVFVISGLVQFICSAQAGRFNPELRPDIRPVVRVIAADKSFMQGQRRVYVSDPNLAYYIHEYGIDKSAVINRQESFGLEAVGRLDSVLADRDFYYVHLARKSTDLEVPELVASMKQRYQQVCEWRHGQVHLFRFRQAPPVSASAAVLSCAHLADTDPFFNRSPK
jgi:hypothetical protein